MKQTLTLVVLLATTLAVAACGGSGTDRVERSAPNEPQRTQAESAQHSVPEQTGTDEVPADEAAENQQESKQENNGPSGPSVTTLGGEVVRLGGQGDVTALFFMAGW